MSARPLANWPSDHATWRSPVSVFGGRPAKLSKIAMRNSRSGVPVRAVGFHRVDVLEQAAARGHAELEVHVFWAEAAGEAILALDPVHEPILKAHLVAPPRPNPHDVPREVGTG